MVNDFENLCCAFTCNASYLLVPLYCLIQRFVNCGNANVDCARVMVEFVLKGLPPGTRFLNGLVNVAESKVLAALSSVVAVSRSVALWGSAKNCRGTKFRFLLTARS